MNRIRCINYVSFNIYCITYITLQGGSFAAYISSNHLWQAIIENRITSKSLAASELITYICTINYLQTSQSNEKTKS